jgi:hypothetical protein
VTPARDRVRSLRFTADPSIEPLRLSTFHKRVTFREMVLQRGVYLTVRGAEHGTYTLVDHEGRETARVWGVPLLSYETGAPRRDLWPEIRAAFSQVLADADPSDTQPLLYRGWLPYPNLPDECRRIPVGYNSSFEIADDWSERVTRGSAYTTEGEIGLEVRTDSSRLPAGSGRMLQVTLQFGGTSASLGLPADHADGFEALVQHVFALARAEGTLPGAAQPLWSAVSGSQSG